MKWRNVKDLIEVSILKIIAKYQSINSLFWMRNFLLLLKFLIELKKKIDIISIICASYEKNLKQKVDSKMIK